MDVAIGFAPVRRRELSSVAGALAYLVMTQRDGGRREHCGAEVMEGIGIDGEQRTSGAS